jgi:hypothetical protein
MIAFRRKSRSVGPERGRPIDALGWFRVSWRAAGLLLALLICVPVHYIWRAIHYGSPMPRVFLYCAARLCGARLRVQGTPLKRDVFYISNHLSWVDILALGGASGTAFVSKAEIGQAPLVGWLAKLNRTVFVSREDRLGVAEQINRLREALAEWPAADLRVETGRHYGPYWQGLSTAAHVVFANLLRGIRDDEVRIDLHPDPDRDATRACRSMCRARRFRRRCGRRCAPSRRARRAAMPSLPRRPDGRGPPARRGRHAGATRWRCWYRAIA